MLLTILNLEIKLIVFNAIALSTVLYARLDITREAWKQRDNEESGRKKTGLIRTYIKDGGS